MKRSFLSVLALSLLSLSTACVNSVPGSVSYPESAPIPQREGGSLADLLTGSVVSEAEQQLRDTLQRQIVLDFPIKLGVLFYQYDSKLDASDRAAAFDGLRTHLSQPDLVSEVLQIPDSLVGSEANLESLRSLGARFQTDVLVLVTGAHSYGRARNQNLSFFDSFSDKAYYESEVRIEAIALDIYTGTFLTPFSVAIKGEPRLLDRADPNFTALQYQYQKETENAAWQAMQAEALDRLQQLKRSVESRTNQPTTSEGEDAA